MFVADTPHAISYYHLCTQISALRLEMIGLRHSRGSVYAHVKRQYQLKGNKASVLAQLEQKKEQMLAERQAQLNAQS